MKLNEWVRAARLSCRRPNGRPLTMAQLGDELGRSKGNIHAWEKGTHNPSYEQIVRISLLTGFPMPDPQTGDAHKEEAPHTGGGLAKLTLIDNTAIAIPFVEWQELEQLILKNANELSANPERLYFNNVAHPLGPRCKVSRVPDNTLHPHLFEGDEVVLDPDFIPVDESIVLAKTPTSGAILRIYEQLAGSTFRLSATSGATPWRSDERNIEILAVVVRITRLPAYMKRK